MHARVDAVARRGVVVACDVDQVEDGGGDAVGDGQVGREGHEAAKCLGVGIEELAVHLALALVGLEVATAALGVGAPAQGAAGDDRPVDAAGDGTRGVSRVQMLDHLPGRIHAAFARGFGHLVADGVHDHAGVVVVMVHHRIEVGHVVQGPLPGVVARALVLEPHVPGLVHDVHAQCVAGLEQGARRGVVGAADGVVASLLEATDAAPLGLVVRGRP